MCAKLCFWLAASGHWDGIGFPFSHCFFFFVFFFFRIRELWEDNASLLEKPMVQVLRNAEICLKTGISSDTCMLLYKCKPLQ